MTTKHTPGPWLHRAKSESVHISSPTHPYGDCIFQFADEGAPNDHDLTLILAAPVLLEALSGLLDAYLKPDDRVCCTGLHCGCMGATHRDLAEHIAREAIALATLDTNEQSGL